MTFKELNIAGPILRAIDEKGYEKPTPIQEKGIPTALSGRDMLGIAQTGTGKTAAFAVPIIEQIMKQREQRRLNKLRSQSQTEEVYSNDNGVNSAHNSQSEICGQQKLSRKERHRREDGKGREHREIMALILTPTRELALQIDECFTDYGKYTELKHTVIFGGVKQNSQVEKLRRGIDILIATPGRLLDLMGQGYINLKNIKYFVLDEADRMLDMGFINDVRRILPNLPKKRQTLFFSATMPKDIVALSNSILKDPIRIEVTPVSSAVDIIDQKLYFVEKPQKKNLLIDVLRKEKNSSVLVFSRTKHGADGISRILKRAGIRSEALHGNKSQSQRQRALSDFKEGRIKVMVATDIAARGIDINKLDMVINYDMPDVAETYVHRIGRTGRAGESGRALTFCSQDEHSMIKNIQKLTGKKMEMVMAS